MNRYFIYIDWKDGNITEGYYVAENKESAIKQALKYCDRDNIIDISVFKELRGVKW